MPANLEEMVGAAFDCDYDDELQELDITYEDNVAFREQLELEYQVDNSDDEDIDEGIYDDQDIVDDDEMVLPFRPIEDRVLGHIPRHAEETWWSGGADLNASSALESTPKDEIASHN